MAIVAAYNYEVEASLILENGVEYDLLPNTFRYIVIDNDYDTRQMPAIYISLKLNSDLYDIMVKNIDTAIISLFIYKYDKNAVMKLRRKYIEGQFIYFMDTNPNYESKLEAQINGNNEDTTGSNYKEGCIGLLQIESLNNNKIVNNCVIRNSRLGSIVHHFTKHMNMVIEPFPDNPIINEIIIPPMDSITKLLAYINDKYAFYPGKYYRYYRDFNLTYLLSSDGNPIDSGDSQFSTLILNIVDKTIESSMQNSTIIDSANGAYVIDIESTSTSMDINITKDKSFNSIMAIDTFGNVEKVSLDIPTNKYSSEKVLIQRVTNDNIDDVYSFKDTINKTSIILSVTKSEIDNSLLTPNREYQVRNHEMYKQYDGRFLLSSKKEVFVSSEDNAFIGSTSFTLRKII